jgi:hypothetical protein
MNVYADRKVMVELTKREALELIQLLSQGVLDADGVCGGIVSKACVYESQDGDFKSGIITFVVEE